MPSGDSVQRFNDIVENIDRIARFMAGMDAGDFRNAAQTVLAVKCILPIIGEAAAKLDPLASEPCPEIAWRQIRGLGNRRGHDDDNVDVFRIWTLLDRHLPPPGAACLNALRALGASGSEA